MSRSNIVDEQWGSDNAYYIQFQLRREGSRWYRFSGSDAAAAANGSDPAGLAGSECGGPPLDFGKGFGQSATTADTAATSAESTAGELAEFGEAAGLL